MIASWLLDLTAAALAKDPALSEFAGRVSDSGEGRWTIKAAIDEGVPAPVLTTALYERSRRAARPTFRTSCSRPCGSSSADIKRKPPPSKGEKQRTKSLSSDTTLLLGEFAASIVPEDTTTTWAT